MLSARNIHKLAAPVRHMSTGRNVVILSAVRTPIGSFKGKLASFTAPQLGTIAAKEAVARSGVPGKDFDEAILGNVIGAGTGQAPTRQALIHAGLPWTVPATTINKVCSSGMKSVMFAAQSIMTGQNDVVLAGGFESMSNIPYYLPKARSGYGLGHQEVQDGIIKDGLWDAFDDHHMGNCAEVCAESYDISRKEQDTYALESYRRTAAAHEAGYFKDEIVPVEVKTRSGTEIFEVDEEFQRLNKDKVPSLRPAFKKNGTVTAANASSINDGASCLVIASEEYAIKHGLKPIARILGFADAAKPSVEFTTAPADAIPKAIRNAGIEQSDVDFWEINEAFSAVAIANQRLLNIDPETLNVFGGAVSLGHPIGCSGARIITTLTSVLSKKSGKIGVAGICNGGGGASAIVIEKM